MVVTFYVGQVGNLSYGLNPVGARHAVPLPHCGV